MLQFLIIFCVLFAIYQLETLFLKISYKVSSVWVYGISPFFCWIHGARIPQGESKEHANDEWKKIKCTCESLIARLIEARRVLFSLARAFSLSQQFFMHFDCLVIKSQLVFLALHPYFYYLQKLSVIDGKVSTRSVLNCAWTLPNDAKKRSAESQVVKLRKAYLNVC